MNTKKLINNISNILNWVFGIIFGFMWIISIWFDPIPAIILLIMAATILPPANHLIHKYFNIKLSAWTKAIILIIWLIVFSISINTKSNNNENTITEQKEEIVSLDEVIIKNYDEIENNENIVVEENNIEIFEVLKDRTEWTAKTITILLNTEVSKEEIIEINNKIIAKHSNNRLTHLYIHYFNNKTIANTYFDIINNLSEEDADELFTHYIATYQMNNTSNINRMLFNKNNDRIELKQNTYKPEKENIIGIIEFKELRKRNPDNDNTALWLEIVIPNNNISKEDIVNLITELTNNIDKAVIKIYNDIRAREEEQEWEYSEIYDEWYIAFFVKNKTNKWAYRWLNEVRRFQEAGYFADLFWTTTTL